MNENNNHQLDVLTREGVLINVSIRYWRATKKLNAEDLGLDPESVETRLISLGHKKKKMDRAFGSRSSSSKSGSRKSSGLILTAVAQFLQLNQPFARHDVQMSSMSRSMSMVARGKRCTAGAHPPQSA